MWGLFLKFKILINVPYLTFFPVINNSIFICDKLVQYMISTIYKHIYTVATMVHRLGIGANHINRVTQY